MHRRELLIAAGLTAAEVSTPFRALAQEKADAKTPAKRKGPIRHSVCRWCYSKMPLDELCSAVAKMGGSSVELLDEKDWPVPAKHGLVCAVATGPGTIDKGWNRLEHHDELVKKTEELLPKAAHAGIPGMVVFSGNRNGLSDAQGAKNCIAGLRRVAPLAEGYGVTLLLELLNSRVDHGDYQFDKIAYGADVIRWVDSPNVKILYDIYHAQIMEGDVIHTIRDRHPAIGHYHTGGVPGRNELDENQELNYRAIARAIVDTGYEGYIAQEFIPSGRRPALEVLEEAFGICSG